jgi:hypothetical protein
MITLVNIGSFSGDEYSQGLYTSRSVQDNEIAYFYEISENRYDEYGEDPRAWCRNCRAFYIEQMYTEMDSVYGEEVGHYDIALLMLADADETYEDNAVRLDNLAIEYWISRDPDQVEEFREMSQSGIAIDDVIIFVGIFIGIAALIGLVGIRVFGSGLAEVSITFIVKVVMFLLLWGLLSLASASYITSLPVVGSMLWIFLTFIYALGCFFNLTESGEGG